MARLVGDVGSWTAKFKMRAGEIRQAPAGGWRETRERPARLDAQLPPVLCGHHPPIKRFHFQDPQFGYVGARRRESGVVKRRVLTPQS